MYIPIHKLHIPCRLGKCFHGNVNHDYFIYTSLYIVNFYVNLIEMYAIVTLTVILFLPFLPFVNQIEGGIIYQIIIKYIYHFCVFVVSEVSNKNKARKKGSKWSSELYK